MNILFKNQRNLKVRTVLSLQTIKSKKESKEKSNRDKNVQ